MVNFVQWYGAPIVMLSVSALYFVTTPRRPAFASRLVASSPGVIGTALYLGAMWLHSVRPVEYRPFLATPYGLTFLLPLLAIVVSFFVYRGPRVVHLAQVPNVLALGWALFVGGMAVSGDWL